jgi:hypothetical protein
MLNKIVEELHKNQADKERYSLYAIIDKPWALVKYNTYLFERDLMCDLSKTNKMSV